MDNEGKQELEELTLIDLVLGNVSRHEILTPQMIQDAHVSDEMLEYAYEHLEQEDDREPCPFTVTKPVVQQLLAALFGELQRRHPGMPAKRACPEAITDLIGRGGRLIPGPEVFDPLNPPPTGAEPAGYDESTVVLIHQDTPTDDQPLAGPVTVPDSEVSHAPERDDLAELDRLLSKGLEHDDPPKPKINWAIVALATAGLVISLCVLIIPRYYDTAETSTEATPAPTSPTPPRAHTPPRVHALPPAPAHVPLEVVPVLVHALPPAPAPMPPSTGCLETQGNFCVVGRGSDGSFTAIDQRIGISKTCWRVGSVPGRDWEHFPYAELQIGMQIGRGRLDCSNLPAGSTLRFTGTDVDLSVCNSCADPAAPAH